jgi:glycosyltransferase involved in cell wall biosynthesis
MTTVSIIGIVGVPAQYGGFETLAANLIRRAPPGIKFIVFCSSRTYRSRGKAYHSARLRYIPIRANGAFSIVYDLICMLGSLRSDVALVLGVSGAIFLPLFRFFYHGKILVNIDGLEWNRTKWSPIARRFLKYSEAIAVRFADQVISDNRVIQDYVRNRYGIESNLIEYGGDIAVSQGSAPDSMPIPIKGPYAISVCRIEPENNISMILEAFAEVEGMKCVVIGNWASSSYGLGLRSKYSDSRKCILFDPIYDQRILDAYRKHAMVYIHGHEAGGTNPSLVEAMGMGLPVFAFDVPYNRETTENSCRYFDSSMALSKLVEECEPSVLEENGFAMLEIATRRYKWEKITEKYLHLFSRS